MRGCLLLAFGALVACTRLLGQNPSSDADAAMAKPLVSQTVAEQGVYVSGFEILHPEKDPKAFEFPPFQILAGVRNKWYSQIPDLQKSAGRERGITVVDFEINYDGSLGKVTPVESAGDASLDAASSLAILRSAPFSHLPEAYREKTLKIRMHFGYDQPTTAKAPFCDGPNWGAHPAAYVLHNVGDGTTPPKATYSPDPEYSERARKDKYMSLVHIAGTVDPKGSFTDLCVSQAAGEGLDEKAMEAVTAWKFQPATLHGEPVAVRINIETTFRLY